MDKSTDPNISLVHYWLFSMRGGEQVAKNLSQALPISRIYSLFGRESVAREIAKNTPYQWSPLNCLPGIEKYYRNLLPAYPFACHRTKIADCDIVISNESGPAKAFQMPAKALHICNCFTPMRYLWSHSREYLESFTGMKRLTFRACLPFLRQWDLATSKKVHHFVSISKHVQKRVKKYYERESIVIYPPVRYNMFSVSPKKEDYYLVVSALVPYKRIDLAVQAFNKLGYPLKIAGDGPEANNLHKMAEKNIEFLGRIADRELPNLYSKAKAFIFPGEEDYGITPLEAQASGTPIIGFKKGGLVETTKEGQTAILYEDQAHDSLIQAVEKFEASGVNLDPPSIRNSVSNFREEEYRSAFRGFVYRKWAEWRENHQPCCTLRMQSP